MPLTELDSTSALVLIDLQKGFTGLPTAHSMQEIIARAASLAATFRKRNLPVILVNVTGLAPGRTDESFPDFKFPDNWTELVEELNASSQDHLVSKQRWGAFIGTDLDQYLRSKGVTQVFIGGIATSIGVESTARSAFDLGYNVVLVSDALTDMDIVAHNHALEKIFPRMSQIDTTNNIIEKLQSQTPVATK
jgi:nicotinamidase-related amidase